MKAKILCGGLLAALVMTQSATAQQLPQSDIEILGKAIGKNITCEMSQEGGGNDYTYKVITSLTFMFYAYADLSAIGKETESIGLDGVAYSAANDMAGFVTNGSNGLTVYFNRMTTTRADEMPSIRFTTPNSITLYLVSSSNSDGVYINGRYENDDGTGQSLYNCYIIH